MRKLMRCAAFAPLPQAGGVGGGPVKGSASSAGPTPNPYPLRKGDWLACLATTFLLLPALAPNSARAAPPVILSAAPDSVAVTLYRDPDRGEGAINRDDPTAFALIAETRTVTLPPGEVTVRFEGVAGGIVPQTAILFGTSPRERNRDAALLSQGGLVDAFTGQHVVLRRTDRATGKVTEERATIRSAADRMIIDTPRGAEAVYCTGLNQTLIYPNAPATLSAKPVLSMTTKDQPGGTVTITLAYIATGFDWDATYVATLAGDGKSMALFAWLTMASGDETSFEDATTAAVAGRVNRSDATRDDTGRNARNAAAWLNRSAGCWPAGTTSDIALYQPMTISNGAAPMSMIMEADMPMAKSMGRDEFKMQAGGALASVVAKSENLGDLKLYSIPVPVTVAARSQKQVAFLQKERVTGQLVYHAKVDGEEPGEPQMLFRFRNRKADGLGDPLPAGKAVVYQDSAYGRMVVGESSLPDKAVDEEVEMVFGGPANVTQVTEALGGGSDKWTDHAVTIRNANPFPIRYEIDFPTGGGTRFLNLPARLLAKPGKRVWAVTIPANGTTKLTYRTADIAE